MGIQHGLLTGLPNNGRSVSYQELRWESMSWPIFPEAFEGRQCRRRCQSGKGIFRKYTGKTTKDHAVSADSLASQDAFVDVASTTSLAITTA
jgi:hypothetical protein